MKTCQYHDNVYEYLDGDLTATQAQEVEAHMAQCRACADQAAGWKRLREGFAYVPTARMRRSVTGDLLAEIRRVEAVPKWRRWVFSPGFGAAAAVFVLAIVLGVTFLLPGTGPTPPPPTPGAVLTTFKDVMPDTEVFRREHALFARGGTGFDRNVWTAAVNLESLSLLDR